MILFFIIIILIAGGWVGYRLGGWGTDRLNHTQRSEINLLKAHNHHWSAEARNKYTLSNQVAREQSQNVISAMNVVIHFLDKVRSEQANTLSAQEQHQIGELINQAKQIARS